MARSVEFKEVVSFLKSHEVEEIEMGSETVPFEWITFIFENFQSGDVQNWSMTGDDWSSPEEVVEGLKSRELLKELKQEDSERAKWIVSFLEYSHEGYAWFALRDGLFGALIDLFEKHSQR